jgi:hypothetical protein
VQDAWCDGSENDRLILEFSAKLSEEQKRLFSEGFKKANPDEVHVICWRSCLIVRITLKRKNCSYARMDLPRRADDFIRELFAHQQHAVA